MSQWVKAFLIYWKMRQNKTHFENITIECFSISALIQLSLIIKQLEAFEIFQITQTKQRFFMYLSCMNYATTRIISLH